MTSQRCTFVSLVAAIAVLVTTLYCACLTAGSMETPNTQTPSCCVTQHHAKLPDSSHPVCQHCAGNLVLERGAGPTSIVAAGGWLDAQGTALLLENSQAARPVQGVSTQWGLVGMADRGNQSLLRLHCALRI